MDANNNTFIRYYRAPATLIGGQPGIWYGEYDGIFAVRECIVCPGSRTDVAPFDVKFHEASHPTGPPVITGIERISWHTFESLWAEYSQARLDELALEHGDTVVRADIGYFRMPFPVELKIGEAASDIYVEYAQGAGRRSFEVFADHTLVAPYDIRIPEGDTEEMLRVAREGVDADGDIIDPLLRPVRISHADFEARWEQHALPRLQLLAN